MTTPRLIHMASRLGRAAPVNYQRMVDKMTSEERGELCRHFEAIAERAAFLARYLDERHGFGCGDQGHKKAVKSGNRAGRMVWCKVFGYHEHHDLTI